MGQAGRSEVGVVQFCRLKTTDRRPRSCVFSLRGSPRSITRLCFALVRKIATTDRQLLGTPKLTCHLQKAKKWRFSFGGVIPPVSSKFWGIRSASKSVLTDRLCRRFLNMNYLPPAQQQNVEAALHLHLCGNKQDQFISALLHFFADGIDAQSNPANRIVSM